MITRVQLKIILVGVSVSIFCLNSYGKFDPVLCNEKLKESANDISNRQFKNVFIQEEHEGNLNQNAQLIGTTGNIFSYYRPLEIRENLVDQVKSNMDWSTKVTFKIKSLLSNDSWEALDLESKLQYLDLYEKTLLEEKGPEAVWNYQEFLPLIKKANAPAYLSDHVTFEDNGEKPIGKDRFRKPEVMTKKDQPALTVSEAINRADKITAEINHGPPHFHIFTTTSLEKLRDQSLAINRILQITNDQMFAEQVAAGTRNLSLNWINPWSLNRSKQVERLISDASQKAAVTSDQLHSEKYSFIAFRYWGLDVNQNAIVSFEIRGGNFDPLPKNSSVRIEGLESVPQPKTISNIKNYLNLFVLIAHRLNAGSLPLIDYAIRDLDPKKIEQSFQRYVGQTVSLDRILRLLSPYESGWILPSGAVATGLLFPFSDLEKEGASPATQNLIQEFVVLDKSSQSRMLVKADSYLLKETYRQWADEFKLKNARRVSQLNEEIKKPPISGRP